MVDELSWAQKHDVERTWTEIEISYNELRKLIQNALYHDPCYEEIKTEN